MPRTDEWLARTERQDVSTIIATRAGLQAEVEFAGSQRLQLRGSLDRRMLRELIDALSSR